MSAPDKATAEIFATRKIEHGEAREIAQRLVNSHFHKEPCARITIPAERDRDDDILIMSYIRQQQQAHEELYAALDRAREKLQTFASEHPDPGPDTWAVLDEIRAALAKARGAQ